MLTEIRIVGEDRNLPGTQNETVRILVHNHDILQVYEKHTKRDTKTYAVIRSPNGSSNCIEIRETIADVHKLVREESFLAYPIMPTAPNPLEPKIMYF